ncbi:hypothetical protein JNW90_11875 [Micromonospora sp. STR1s_5]|nr:hypothetical protein [Micromonospora sp. STR1s_5]
MTIRARTVGWVAAVIGGLALLGLGVLFVTLGLDQSDKVASVTGAFSALLGLPLSVYGIVLARRNVSGQPAAEGARKVSDPASPALGLHQQIHAGRDAYTAGGDQHFGSGGPGAGR